MRLEGRLQKDLPNWDRRHHGIERLLTGWSALAAGGRPWGDVEEYLHELGIRDGLLDVMSAASGPLRDWLVRTVDEIDDVYLSRTDLDIEDLMWVGAVDDPWRWWRRRLPQDEFLRRAIVRLAPSMREHRRRGGSFGGRVRWAHDGDDADDQPAALRLELHTSESGKAGFFAAVRASLPLDPPMGPYPNWDGLSDSLWEGLFDLPEDRIVLHWRGADRFGSESPGDFQVAVEVLAHVAMSIADRGFTVGRPKDLRIILHE